MTISIEIVGPNAGEPVPEAAELLRLATGEEPARTVSEPTREDQRDIATAIAFASLILSVPSAVLATIDIADRFRKRKELIESAKRTQAALIAADSQATLRLPDAQPVDLRATSPDTVADLLLEKRGD